MLTFKSNCSYLRLWISSFKFQFIFEMLIFFPSGTIETFLDTFMDNHLLKLHSFKRFLQFVCDQSIEDTFLAEVFSLWIIDFSEVKNQMKNSQKNRDKFTKWHLKYLYRVVAKFDSFQILEKISVDQIEIIYLYTDTGTLSGNNWQKVIIMKPYWSVHKYTGWCEKCIMVF